MSECLDHARKYHAAIREVLIREWDPIGVGEIPEATDEYDSYISEVHGLLVRRESLQKLVDFLWWVETEHMGLAGSRYRTEQIAQRLMRLPADIAEREAPGTPDEVETLYVHGATVCRLAIFLAPEVPWVWILGHMPDRSGGWWDTELPINRLGSTLTADYRLVSYDLMLPTERFLDSLSAFEEHGILLIQSRQRMPSTLDLSRIPQHLQSGILLKNGAFLSLNLPHPMETAQVQCFQKGYLSSKAQAE